MSKLRRTMSAETRLKLIEVARRSFGTAGYAEASMDDITRAAGLTRGALYHHFGGKRGLFEAVCRQIDSEMTERLRKVAHNLPTGWESFIDECIAYVEMALVPEIQRIIFREGSVVLGNALLWQSAGGCMTQLSRRLDELKADGILINIDTEVAAHLIIGAGSQVAHLIAHAKDPRAKAKTALATFRAFLEGLREPDTAVQRFNSPR